MDRWVAATLAVAALVHLGMLYALPRRIEARATARMGRQNEMHFGNRPSETSRLIVRPSPDLLYSACPFDLSKGPLKITARVPHSTYWSVSGFDAATNNFFVRNDQQIAGDSIEIIALRPGMALPPLDAAPERSIVFAPTDRGLFLIRLLINDEKNLPALDALRHQASCETVASVVIAPTPVPGNNYGVMRIRSLAFAAFFGTRQNLKLAIDRVEKSGALDPF